MLSNPQKSLLKRAQRQAGLSDADYREALHLITGCNTSTDPRVTDEHLDALLAYFEAIHWRGVRSGALKPPCKGNEVFVQEGFWAARNRRGNTSRDRHSYSALTLAIESLENDLATLGYGPDYLRSIKQRVTRGLDDLRSLHAYRAALTRTLSAKQKARSMQPF